MSQTSLIYFEMRAHFGPQSCQEFRVILLTQPPECWDCRYGPQWLSRLSTENEFWFLSISLYFVCLNFLVYSEGCLLVLKNVFEWMMLGGIGKSKLPAIWLFKSVTCYHSFFCLFCSSNRQHYSESPFTFSPFWCLFLFCGFYQEDFLELQLVSHLCNMCTDNQVKTLF